MESQISTCLIGEDGHEEVSIATIFEVMIEAHTEFGL
jgi:hypothetical protein